MVPALALAAAIAAAADAVIACLAPVVSVCLWRVRCRNCHGYVALADLRWGLALP